MILGKFNLVEEVTSAKAWGVLSDEYTEMKDLFQLNSRINTASINPSYYSEGQLQYGVTNLAVTKDSFLTMGKNYDNVYDSFSTPECFLLIKRGGVTPNIKFILANMLVEENSINRVFTQVMAETSSFYFAALTTKGFAVGSRVTRNGRNEDLEFFNFKGSDSVYFTNNFARLVQLNNFPDKTLNRVVVKPNSVQILSINEGEVNWQVEERNG